MWITFVDGGRGYHYNDTNDMEQIRITKVIRTGTSLCVVIPKEILQALSLQRGDQVRLNIFNNQDIIIHKITHEDFTKLK